MWMPLKGSGRRLSPVSRRKEGDSDRPSDVSIGVAAASETVRADVDCALPERQRWRESGFGPKDIMSCPDGVELGGARAGSTALG